jgi:protein-S-isoprenylcysteine O-methyltransferase Ste14
MAIERAKLIWLWEKFTNLCLALFFARFIYIFAVDFYSTHRLSSLLLLSYQGALVLFSLARAMPRDVTRDPLEWMVGIMGTLLPIMLQPAAAMNDHIALVAMQLAGTSISLMGLLSLNRSFGTVAANRGVKSSGMYGVVRHPLYAGYLLINGGFLIQQFTPFNALIILVWLILTVWRIRIEEGFLSKDAAYVAYKDKVRWRLVPFVF